MTNKIKDLEVDANKGIEELRKMMGTTNAKSR